MRTLILYVSQAGSTKKYAEDIAASCGADVTPLKRFRARNYKNYDTIVFGGWIMGNTIQGLNKFLSNYGAMKEKNVIVFSSGMSLPSSESRELIIEQNILDLYHVRYYQLRGSFNFKNIKFPYNFLFSNSLRMIARNPDATPDQKVLLELKERPLSYYDQDKVDKIVSVIRSFNVIEAKTKDK